MKVRISVKFSEEDKKRLKRVKLKQVDIKRRMFAFEHDMHELFEDLVGYEEDRL